MYNRDLSNRALIIAAIERVPIKIAIRPIAGKKRPLEMLERARPIEVYVNARIIPHTNAARNIGNVSIIHAQPLPITRMSTK